MKCNEAIIPPLCSQAGRNKGTSSNPEWDSNKILSTELLMSACRAVDIQPHSGLGLFPPLPPIASAAIQIESRWDSSDD
jgi:hypothetical protein